MKAPIVPMDHGTTGAGMKYGGDERRGEERRREEQQMQPPGLAVPTPQRAREDEMASLRLVRPVGGPGPARERRGERRGGPGMRRMYKRVNHFPVRERCRPPCEQERAQVHRRT